MSYHSLVAKDRLDASTVFMLCVLGDDVLVKGGLADAKFQPGATTNRHVMVPLAAIETCILPGI